MSITTSLSFTFVNTYASQSARPAAAAERPAQAEQTHQHACGESRPASRQNRLVEAMMSALQELGIGGQAAPATDAAAGTDTGATSNAVAVPAAVATAASPVSVADAAMVESAASATATPATLDATAETADAAAEPAVTLESAVRQFAHELFSALRQIGRGESSERGANRIDGDGGRRHHHGQHGHHGWRREGYGDMSQRLDALAQTFAAPSAVAGESPLSTSISLTLTIQNGTAPASAQTVATNGEVAMAKSTELTAPTGSPEVAEVAAGAEAQAMIDVPAANETLPATPAADSSTAQTVARNPLLDAFTQLFGVLKPQAAQADMADTLRSFLQSLAQAMRPDSVNGNQMHQVGALVNVTA